MKTTTGILLIVCLCAFTVVVFAKPVRDFITVCTERFVFEGRTVRCDYSSIQAAVDHASPGDIIVVGPETFIENVVVDRELTIQGAGKGESVVDGNALGSVFVNHADLTLRDLTIQNGLARMGGGVDNFDGRLSLVGCEVRDNRARDWGGGIQSYMGEVVITSTLIVGNSASDPYNNAVGGGLSVGLYYSYVPYPDPPPRTYRTSLRARRGQATLTVTDSEIRDNTAAGHGGGIHITNDEVDVTAAIYNSVIIGNESQGTGGIVGVGNVTLSMSTVANNRGGGIAVAGQVVITNTTITGNESSRYAGGISSGSAVDIRNSTISHNISPPTYGALAGPLGLADSIVAHNVGGACTTYYTPSRPVSYGNNLSSDTTCGFNAPGDMENTDPLLLPLGDNGGPAPTCALHPDSPAIDAGGDSCELTDQRGAPRPLDGDGDGTAKCDIGAYEALPPNVKVNPTGPLHDLVFELLGADHDLVAPLHNALRILEDADPANDAEAVDSMLAFIAAVDAQRETLTDERADELIEEAQRIIDLLMLP